jgi:predicted nucleic-acid-binding protein
MRRLQGKPEAVRAVDTNVVVRFLTADDPRQARAARRVFVAGEVYLGTTVILETEWVLRLGYGFTARQIAEGLLKLGGLPGVVIEEPARTAQALDWMAAGLDFADALHLARSSHCNTFVSFDRTLAKRAKGLTPIAVEVLR